MGRFLLGFVAGVIVTAVIAATLGVGSASRTPERAPPAAHAAATPIGTPDAPRPRVHRADDAGRAPASGSAAPTSASAPPPDARDDALALLRTAIAARDADQTRRCADALRTADPTEPAPRDVIVALSDWLPAADTRSAVGGALRVVLMTWPATDIELLLREIAAAQPGTSALERAAPTAAWRLGTVHELNALAADLARATDPDRRRAAVRLAATSRRPDPLLVYMVFEAAEEPDLRAFAAEQLAGMARAGRGGDRARELAGRAALAVFTGDASRAERESAVAGLAFGGDEGLAIAERLVREGGLRGRAREWLIAGLVGAGRALDLIRDRTLDVRLRAELAAAVLDSDPLREADVLALWPSLPELMESQDDDLWLTPEESAAALGRFDLVEGLLLEARLAPVDRAAAWEVLLQGEHADHERALELIERLMGSPESGVALRQQLLDSISVGWDVGGHRHAARFLRLAERVAREDANEWVRNDAADVAAFLRAQVPATEER